MINAFSWFGEGHTPLRVGREVTRSCCYPLDVTKTGQHAGQHFFNTPSTILLARFVIEQISSTIT